MDEQKFEALASIVADVDAAGPPTPEQVEAQTAADTHDAAAREWGTIAFMIGGALSMIAPELRQVYTEEACFAWGQSAATVAEKYGWSDPGNVPEIGLAISTVGLAVPSYLAIRLRLRQLEAAKAAQQQRDTVEAQAGGGNGS